MGEETIVDTDVRRVWQIDSEQISFRNPDWKSVVAEIVQSVSAEFGIDHEVNSDLYKLLIYEEGSFFKPHRDSEKQDGMFATLVVCLPSRHRGGKLIVSHDGQTKEIDFGCADAEFRIQYAAFYTDCRHEIEPVTSGHRISLVYNLSLASKKGQPAAPRNSQAVEKSASLLSKLFADDSRDKIAVPLTHEYTEAGLSRANLKGADRTCMEVLFRACDRLGYRVYLALMCYYQMGDVDYELMDYDDRWSYDEDDAEMGEVFEESRTLDYWVDSQDRPMEFGKMEIDEEEILTEIDFDLPTEQEVHEATGNEGMTIERWYRQAMVVIWPQEHHFRILASEGQYAALPGLKEVIDSQENPSDCEECRAFAGEIIDLWQSSGTRRDSCRSPEMLEQLERIADPELANRFIRDVLPKDIEGKEGLPLKMLCQRLGWETLADSLSHFVRSLSQKRETGLAAFVSIFKDLCDSAKMTPQQKSVCQDMATELVEGTIKRWDDDREEDRWIKSASRQGIIESLFHSLSVIERDDLLQQFLSHSFATPQHYGLHNILIPSAKNVHAWLDKKPSGINCFRILLNHCIEALQSLTATPVEEPSDWAADIHVSCDCHDCSELQQFLLDPVERIHRFPVRKDRRQHLHPQIERHDCDMDHVTERKGSPHTLVCTKNRASYDRKKVQYGIDTQLLLELRDIKNR